MNNNKAVLNNILLVGLRKTMTILSQASRHQAENGIRDISNTSQEQKQFKKLLLLYFIFIVIIILKNETQIHPPLSLKFPLVELYFYWSPNFSFHFGQFSELLKTGVTHFNMFSHLFFKQAY
jgi:hypothetical protein